MIKTTTLRSKSIKNEKILMVIIISILIQVIMTIMIIAKS